MRFQDFFTTDYTPDPKEIRRSMLTLLFLDRGSKGWYNTVMNMFPWNAYYAKEYSWVRLIMTKVSLEEFDSVYKPEILKLLAACEEELKDD